MIYLDTSALLKLYVEEKDRELVLAAIEESERIATSTVAYAEARAALARRFREGDFTGEEHRGAVLSLDEDWRTYDRLAVSNLVAYSAGDLAHKHALRGYDSVHLASALRFADRFEDLSFLAFDDRLTGAAREAELPVFGDTTDAGRGADGRSENQ